MNSKDAEKEADVLIAKEKVKQLKEEGVLLDSDTPYSHNSTYGGKLNAFIPRRIRSNNIWIGVLIFLLIMIVLELLDRLI